MSRTKEKKLNGRYHPCTCTSYNGGQCYNCLNGAHHICEAKRKCGFKTRSVGLTIVVKKTPASKERK